MRTLPPRRRLPVPSVRFLLLSLLLLLAHAPSPSHAAPFRYFCTKDAYDKKTMTTGPLALWETMKHEIETYLSNQSIHNLTAKGDRAEREICMYVGVMEEAGEAEKGKAVCKDPRGMLLRRGSFGAPSRIVVGYLFQSCVWGGAWACACFSLALPSPFFASIYP